MISWSDRFAGRTERMTSSAIREILKVTEHPEVISFAGGMPAPEVFPVEEVAAVTERILRTAGPVALQYGPTEGHTPLRALIAERIRLQDVPVTADNVLITAGSQQGIDLVGKIMLDPGDRVAVESPTYVAALQAWNSYEAELTPLPSDDGGMVVDALARTDIDPVMVYALPNFQNPRGVTLTADRRQRLVELARSQRIAVLEDDPYHDLRFAGEHLPPLIALDAGLDGGHAYAGNVIALGSFSKILSPGIRVGWVVAPVEVIRKLTLAKQAVDLHTSMLAQLIAHEMLQSDFLDHHTELIVETYRHRRDVMLHALAEYFPDGVRWTRPDGGMFLWVELPPEIDAAELLAAATAEKVAFVPGQGFHADGSGRNTFRLNFSNASPERIREGVRRLRRAYDSIAGNRGPGTRHAAPRPVEAR